MPFCDVHLRPIWRSATARWYFAPAVRASEQSWLRARKQPGSFMASCNTLWTRCPHDLNACILFHTKVASSLCTSTFKAPRDGIHKSCYLFHCSLEKQYQSRNINSSLGKFGGKTSWIAATKTATKSLGEDLNMNTKQTWLIKQRSLW